MAYRGGTKGPLTSSTAGLCPRGDTRTFTHSNNAWQRLRCSAAVTASPLTATAADRGKDLIVHVTVSPGFLASAASRSSFFSHLTLLLSTFDPSNIHIKNIPSSHTRPLSELYTPAFHHYSRHLCWDDLRSMTHYGRDPEYIRTCAL